MQQLTKLQKCIDNSTTTTNDTLYIAPVENQNIETLLSLLFTSIPSVTGECKKQLEPFACLYSFPLLSCNKENSTAKIFRPSSGQCKSLRDNVCSELWKMAKNSGFANFLPNCDDQQKFQSQDLLKTCQSER